MKVGEKRRRRGERGGEGEWRVGGRREKRRGGKGEEDNRGDAVKLRREKVHGLWDNQEGKEKESEINGEGRGARRGGGRACEAWRGGRVRVWRG